jgi:DNA-directed RNA polymerase specialized sigma subunit
MAALRSRELSLAKIAIWLEISQMKVHRILARHNGQVRC